MHQTPPIVFADKLDIIKVCSGSYGHSLFWITSDGKLYANGWNNFDPRHQDIIASPILVEYFHDHYLKVIDAATSLYFCLVVCDNGNVYAFYRSHNLSNNTNYGQCGFGPEADNMADKWHKIQWFEDNGIKIVQIAAGSKFSLFVSVDGDLYSAGSNTRGQLGNGEMNGDTYKYSEFYPIKVKFGGDELEAKINIVRVACGHAFCIALDGDGKVYTWGFNAFGQGGNGHTADTCKPWLVERLKDEIVVDIVCGAGYLCVLTIKGECWIWGKNDKFQCCNLKTDNILIPERINDYLPQNKIIKQICLGYYSTMMILCDK